MHILLILRERFMFIIFSETINTLYTEIVSQLAGMIVIVSILRHTAMYHFKKCFIKDNFYNSNLHMRQDLLSDRKRTQYYI